MRNWIMVLVLAFLGFSNFACSKDTEIVKVPGKTNVVQVPGETVLVDIPSFKDELLVKLSEGSNTVASIIFSEEALPALETSLVNFNFDSTIPVSYIAVTVEAVNSGGLKDGDITAEVMHGENKIASAILKAGRLEFQFELVPTIQPTEERPLVFLVKRRSGLLVKKSFRLGIVEASDVDAGNSVIEGLPIWGPVMNTERGEVIFSRDGKIKTKDLKTGMEKSLDPFKSISAHDTEPTVRLGGRMVAFVSSDPFCQQRGIFIMYTNGTGRRRLTSGENKVCSSDITDSMPNISPDGKSIVFVRAVFDKVSFISHSDILIVDVNSSKVRYLTKDLNFDQSPIFSSAGDKIYFVSNRFGNSSIHFISVKGGIISPLITLPTVAISNKTEFAPAVNPLNGKLVFSELEFVEKDGVFSVFQNIVTTGPDLTGRTQITNAKSGEYYENPSWGNNGRIIIRKTQYPENSLSVSSIFIMDSSGSNPRKIPGIETNFGKVSFSR